MGVVENAYNPSPQEVVVRGTVKASHGDIASLRPA